jgi:hypothetical protein
MGTMTKPVMREITQPEEDYFCSYSSGPIRKVKGASAEHAARKFLRSTITPTRERFIYVRTYESQDKRKAYQFKISGKGVKVFPRI